MLPGQGMRTCPVLAYTPYAYICFHCIPTCPTNPQCRQAQDDSPVNECLSLLPQAALFFLLGFVATHWHADSPVRTPTLKAEVVSVTLSFPHVTGA